MKRQTVIAGLLSAIACTPACVPTSQPSRTVDIYADACEPSWLPLEPTCISFARMRGGFRSSNSFNDCRASLQNFIDAADLHIHCVSVELATALDQVAASSSTTIQCYLQNNTNNYLFDRNALRAACPGVQVPRFYIKMPGSALSQNLGAPNCVVANPIIDYNFAPSNSSSLRNCINDVEHYIGRSGYRSAQHLYDTYIDYLRREISVVVDESIYSFNCLAEGRSLC